jgi:hypothetical protein
MTFCLTWRRFVWHDVVSFDMTFRLTWRFVWHDVSFEMTFRLTWRRFVWHDIVSFDIWRRFVWHMTSFRLTYDVVLFDIWRRFVWHMTSFRLTYDVLFDMTSFRLKWLTALYIAMYILGLNTGDPILVYSLVLFSIQYAITFTKRHFQLSEDNYFIILTSSFSNVTILSDQFSKFKLDVAKEAINSRSGKPISPKVFNGL